MSALYFVPQIRAIENSAYAELAPGELMKRAGQAAYQAAAALYKSDTDNAPVLVLAGPGNNGGDALIAADLLARDGFSVVVMLYSSPEKYSGEAHEAYTLAKNGGCKFIGIADCLSLKSWSWSLIIDGLFGIGLQRPLVEPLYSLVQRINQINCPVLALDVPSGLDADTGAIAGKSGIAVRATHTLTFIADKPGLHTAFGRDYAGEVTVADLDIDSRHFMPPLARLNAPSLFDKLLVPRLHNSHKGSYGDVAVLGGAEGMGGAVLLSSRAALYCGAGRVLCGFLDHAPAYDAMHPELMCRAAENIALDKGTLVVGPGLGTSDAARKLLEAALHSPAPMVIDADGLNLIASTASYKELMGQRSAPAILTPHPLEAARLLGISSSEIQADRLKSAAEIASRFACVTILKGSGTVIAHPDGRLVVNPTGNPGLAAPGSGDVLAGMIGALLSQHKSAWECALAAVWLHGKAADELVLAGTGPIGLTAGELAPQARGVLNRLVAERCARSD